MQSSCRAVSFWRYYERDLHLGRRKKGTREEDNENFIAENPQLNVIFQWGVFQQPMVFHYKKMN